MLLAYFVILAGAPVQCLLHHGGSCNNRCFAENDNTKPCQCDSDCEAYHSCCSDFWRLCRGTESGLLVTQKELNTFGQSLWDHDINRVENALYTLSYQTHANHSVDVAKQPLIVPTDGQLDALLNSPNSTYAAFIQLLDNYELSSWTNEHRPVTEIQEEDQFWALASQTEVMQETFKFLRDNGFIRGDMHAFRTVINELWFESYARSQHGGHRKISGFENVFVGEKHVKKNQNDSHVISGFQNWVHFYQEEKAGNLNYMGYQHFLSDPPTVTVTFEWKKAEAHGKGFFVGTSPEFDIALYTVCALVRRHKPCRMTINGQPLTITTTVHQQNEITSLKSVKLTYHDASQTVITASPSAITSSRSVITASPSGLKYSVTEI